MRGVGQFTEEITIAESLGTKVKRELARIIREDATGINEDAMHSSPFPIVAPPGNVVTRRVGFGDVCLTPTESAVIPRFGTVARRGGSSFRGETGKCKTC